MYIQSVTTIYLLH